ncbi:olfactory receptor 4P4-like [Choloepus didactylus]|uniref:olfactory receptor 4P4-like n=1 Tax=Choloepus didactylus TaxID=27675 RepID=UPI00189F4747|nr:olfactory receptor 4P4-like [Choloepus didactylus]
MENQNNVTEFVFLGLWENKQMELFFCFLFLLCYLAVLMGNFIILLTITCSHLIGQPMYYFLCHLSFMDISFTTVVVPRLIRDLASERKIISYNNCLTQLFTFHLLAAVEILILVSMAFDRYVAIVKPLHYMVIMNWKRCNMLIVMAWGVGFWHSMALLLMVLNLPFCGPNQINHYMCDVKPLLKLVCRDIHVASVLVIANSGLSGALIFPVLMTSYILILYNLRTHTPAARHKALSTCSSHIMVVALFFVPCLYIYAVPAESEIKDKEISVFYTVIIPMLNPFIYTLRNMEIKIALKKVWSQMAHLELEISDRVLGVWGALLENKSSQQQANEKFEDKLRVDQRLLAC